MAKDKNPGKDAEKEVRAALKAEADKRDKEIKDAALAKIRERTKAAEEGNGKPGKKK